jgi:5-(carboxyamino)imidazole ribonucleotide synthase
MMIVPAINLGLEIKVFAEAEGSSAAQATTQVGDYTNLAEVREFAETVDVITFDHEHVPLEVLEALEAESISVQPPSKALKFAQNKLHMRQRLGALGLPMPAWAEIKTAAELEKFKTVALQFSRLQLVAMTARVFVLFAAPMTPLTG